MWIACRSECECLWGCWSAQRAGWKVNGIQEFPGQDTLQSWPFGILGPPVFTLARNFDSRPQSRPVKGSTFAFCNGLTLSMRAGVEHIALYDWQWFEWQCLLMTLTIISSNKFLDGSLGANRFHISQEPTYKEDHPLPYHRHIVWTLTTSLSFYISTWGFHVLPCCCQC